MTDGARASRREITGSGSDGSAPSSAAQCRNKTSHLSAGVDKVACAWAGCANDAVATLDCRSLCQIHFYDIATKRLVEYRDRMSGRDPAGRNRANILKSLSELISEITSLVARTKFLAAEQRDNYLHLTLSCEELYRRVQREAITGRP